MKPIIYLTALALGIFGLAAGIQPDNQLEIFWGILMWMPRRIFILNFGKK